MESITKARVSDTDLRRVVADAFGKADALESSIELSEGWFNSAFDLRLVGGRRVVLKVAPPPEVAVLTYERDIIHAEVDALRRIRAATDVPVPDVLWFDDSGRILGSPAFVMTRLEGLSLTSLRPSLDAATSARLDGELGHHLRTLNDLRGDHFGLLAPTAPRHDRWTDAFTEMFTWVIDDGLRAGVELPVTADALRRAVALTTPALDAVTEPRFVGWDLWDGNVIVDPETTELQGIIDFERAMWGDPLIEVQFGSDTDSPAFDVAYGRPAMFTPAETNRRALYDLYLHLIMATEGTYRQYPEDPFGEWARSTLATDIERVSVTAL